MPFIALIPAKIEYQAPYPHVTLAVADNEVYSNTVVETSEGTTTDEGSNATETASLSTSGEVVSVYCECVRYLREVLGIKIRGNADSIPVNLTEPEVGAVIKMKYPNGYHVALIKYKLIDRLVIQESNYHTCKADERVIMLSDSHIVGYYYVNPNP